MPRYAQGRSVTVQAVFDWEMVAEQADAERLLAELIRQFWEARDLLANHVENPTEMRLIQKLPALWERDSIQT